ncbi:MAG: tetratricopeptide repeat protein [Cyclobacteriaceae bacterium]
MDNNSKIGTLLATSWAKRGQGKYAEAQALLNEAHELCEDNDYNHLGRISHIYGQFESDHNNHQQALEFWQQSLEYYKKDGNSNKIAHSTRHIADIQRRLGDQEGSEKNYRQSLDIYRSNAKTSSGDLANALRGFGLLLVQRGKITEAISVWKEVKKRYQALHLQEGVDEANGKLDQLIKKSE